MLCSFLPHMCTLFGLALACDNLYDVSIIHYNDFHARFEETSLDTPICQFNNNSCIGGFARLYKEIQILRKDKPDALVLNAGDSFVGTFWYSLLKWNVTQKFMNLIPHDAHAIGNHEFSDGPQGLAPYLRALNAPVLAANMDTSEEPLLQGLYKPHIVIERRGRKIGLIGLITPSTKSLGTSGNVVFTDPKEATAREAQELTDKGVDIIVVLSHCGLEVDKELAREVGDNVDIIVGGHSHSLLWNGEAPSEEQVAGPYPIIEQTTNDGSHSVLIVQASAFTKYMGNLTVYFDCDGDYVKWDGNPLYLDRSIPEDEDIKAKLAPYAKMVHATENEVIGNTKRTMRLLDCILGECAIGDMLVDAALEYAKSKMSTSLPMISILSYIQRGNVGDIKKGDITRGLINELLPFNDVVVSYELEGKYVREVLEKGASLEWDFRPELGVWLLQVGGKNLYFCMRVEYNISNSLGKRLVSAYIGDRHSAVPLHDDATYMVVSGNYISQGGDGFRMIRDGKKNVQILNHNQDVLEYYIRKHSPLDIQTDGRVYIHN